MCIETACILCGSPIGPIEDNKIQQIKGFENQDASSLFRWLDIAVLLPENAVGEIEEDGGSYGVVRDQCFVPFDNLAGRIYVGDGFDCGEAYVAHAQCWNIAGKTIDMVKTEKLFKQKEWKQPQKYFDVSFDFEKCFKKQEGWFLIDPAICTENSQRIKTIISTIQSTSDSLILTISDKFPQLDTIDIYTEQDFVYLNFYCTEENNKENIESELNKLKTIIGKQEIPDFNLNLEFNEEQLDVMEDYYYTAGYWTLSFKAILAPNGKILENTCAIALSDIDQYIKNNSILNTAFSTTSIGEVKFPFNTGDTVKIRAGNHYGLQATLISVMKDRGKLKVKLETGKTVTIDWDLIES